jgi:hypothetical protein
MGAIAQQYADLHDRGIVSLWAAAQMYAIKCKVLARLPKYDIVTEITGCRHAMWQHWICLISTLPDHKNSAPVSGATGDLLLACLLVAFSNMARQLLGIGSIPRWVWKVVCYDVCRRHQMRKVMAGCINHSVHISLRPSAAYLI